MPSTDDMKTVAPAPCSAIAGTSARQQASTCRRLTASRASHRAGSDRRNGEHPRWWPTLLTSTSHRPLKSARATTVSGSVMLDDRLGDAARLADCTDALGGPLLVDLDEGHQRAGGSEPVDDRSADPGAAPGDDGDLSIESQIDAHHAAGLPHTPGSCSRFRSDGDRSGGEFGGFARTAAWGRSGRRCKARSSRSL